MKNKKVLLICAIATIIAVSAVFVSATPTCDLWYEVGQIVSSINADDSRSTAIVATVNGEPIYQNAFDRLKALKVATSEANIQMAAEMGLSQEDMELAAKVPTDSELMDSLIEKAVKTQAANKLGLSVSEQEVNAYFAASDKANSNSDSKNADLVENVMNSYCAGLGITYEEYRNTVETDIVREAILFEKLSEYILQESGITREATTEDRNNVLSTHLNTLIAEADIAVK